MLYHWGWCYYLLYIHFNDMADVIAIIVADVIAT